VNRSETGATRALVIAHVLSSFEMGGQERVALDLAREQIARGHRVLAISLAAAPDGPIAEAFAAAGAIVSRVPKGPGVDPSVAWRLRSVLRDAGVDVVHTHNPLPLAYGAVAGRLARAAVVHTKHGANPDGGRRLLLRQLGGHLAHAYVAVSSATAAVARRNRECPPSRLHTVPNGVDLAAFAHDDEARAAVRAELGIPAEAWVFGTVGRLRVEKNFPALVRAAAPLLGPQARLVIVGDGVEMPKIRAAAAAAGVTEWTVLAGARSDVPRLLSAFDAFVMSSDTEGLPLGLVEAMAAGLPVVATDVGGIGEVLEGGRAGALVPAGDEPALREAMAALARDPSAARERGRAARERSASYALGTMVDAYLTIYRRAIEDARRALVGALIARR
jgi:glycosyltransferase involved in cell wall biosynthesis